ncbi:chloride channel protein [Solemya velum gill symbiont]|uniref:Chloride channel protein n=2 Tax=Solemya velum gill symbiont TaxID=2340 RepID=A0A0B0HBJ9_SOVGS|nr:chloride channel protein [Solemya velum gill symbiont]KHF26410.1 chloride channel protein EriC [Solemya velum gill symbiont]OOY35511.1 chloride channel protein [Solemya velum gill symbiont]OOY38535.1 chloride channel protein [Solemya velum gill symbiont]OOY45404.1 chloride channel protein [Solemya velum gill symbiont]OOY48913.1 chloride channel protein [Solemya velum gill symbiont]
MTPWWQKQSEEARLRLARHDALLHLAVLAVIAGVLSGLVIIAFRLLVEELAAFWSPSGSEEDFEAVSLQYRLVLPLLGAVLLAILYVRFGKGVRVLGVARVIERMNYHQGHHSLRGFLMQFFGATIAIVSGHSVGREGPHVFLGAAASSLFGQKLRLPNNSIRTLVACGTAAGIAASFNTPLAGVIFALEVVVMEYTIASFIPVVLAAASATLVSIAAFGNAPAFTIQPLSLTSLTDVPMVILLGLIAGALATLMILLVKLVAGRAKRLEMWQRMLIAGFVMLPFAWLLPQTMGVGYDTVNQLFGGETLLQLALLLVLGKLLATSAVIGLGIPGGIIGPSLFIGAALGAACEALAVSAGMDVVPGFLPLLGMGAMMGATLQAPLAALTAMMELTHAPGIIMPGMLAIVIASMTASEVFGQESIFITMMKAAGLDIDQNPVRQALRRLGVVSAMSTDFSRTRQQIKVGEAQQLLQDKPVWLLVEKDDGSAVLLRAVDLAGVIGEKEEANSDPVEEATIDLLDIPGQRFDATAVSSRATLQEALEKLDTQVAEALYVESDSVTGVPRIYGILTRDMIESAYR